jgi:hypothetical protein
MFNVDLCKYKNIFGEPNTGAHSYRIFNLAIVDIIATIILGIIISFVFKKAFIITLVILFILGIILHKLFCVNTTINNLLFN